MGALRDNAGRVDASLVGEKFRQLRADLISGHIDPISTGLSDAAVPDLDQPALAPRGDGTVKSGIAGGEVLCSVIETQVVQASGRGSPAGAT